MTVKTLRYTHPEKCEKKPSNIIDKPVKRQAPRTKAKINVEPLAPEHNENNSVAPPQYQEQQQPVSKAIPPVPTVPTVPQQHFSNPYANLTQQQLLQLQMKSMNAEILRRRQEKSDNIAKPCFNQEVKNLNNNIYKWFYIIGLNFKRINGNIRKNIR